MSEQPKSLDQVLANAERVGVIGSPSTTGELSVDIINVAVTRKLVGELAMFKYTQDGLSHFVIGQITEIELRNVWHEDPTMRSLVRQKGQIDAISGRQDTFLGKMTISAVFQEMHPGQYAPSILGTIPPTGTYIYAVDDEPLRTLLGAYAQHLFYLGHVYGSKPLLPLWFKHFGSGENGAGEAYHLGIFGKTGSGKSVLAKMVISAYSQHKEMGILVLDPQGEFTSDLQGKDTATAFKLPLKKIVERTGRRAIGIHASSLVLDTWELFQQLLVDSAFFGELSMPRGENAEIAADQIVQYLKKNKIKLSDLHDPISIEKAWEALHDERILKIIYKSEASRNRLVEQIEQTEMDVVFKQIWQPIGWLFDEGRQGSSNIRHMIDYLLTGYSAKEGNKTKHPLPVISVDLSETTNLDGIHWSDTVQLLVIRRILSQLSWRAEVQYKANTTLNTLVVIDEAHRLAGQSFRDEDQNSKAVKATLRDAARTTRKYGLGWMFVSQTLASIDREILQQLRIMFFGFGLSLGQEFQSLRELVGSSKSALDLYRLFRDPHSAFSNETKQYSFMTIGPVSPLSFAGSPLFLSAFTEVEAFMEANKLDDR